MPQGRGLFAGMSVEQNLELGRLKRQTGNGVHWTRERIYEYFPRIRERLDSPADYLSGGEQQMVAVARALSGDVRVLLLDEPFEGLAPAVVEQLFETFDRLRQEIAIIIVDHHLDLALALSDRTVALERGRVIHRRAVQGLARRSRSAPQGALAVSRSAGTGTLSALLRVQRVAQAVAQHIERQDGEKDREARPDRHPRRVGQEALGGVEHRAPGRRRRLLAKPQERKAGLGDDGGGDRDRSPARSARAGCWAGCA